LFFAVAASAAPGDGFDVVSRARTPRKGAGKRIAAQAANTTSGANHP